MDRVGGVMNTCQILDCFVSVLLYIVDTCSLT